MFFVNLYDWVVIYNIRRKLIFDNKVIKKIKEN